MFGDKDHDFTGQTREYRKTPKLKVVEKDKTRPTAHWTKFNIWGVGGTQRSRRWLKDGKASISTDLVSPYPACPGPPSSDPANLHHSCVFLIKLSVFCLPAMFINAGTAQEPLRRCCHCSFPDHHYSSSSTSFSIIVIIGLVNDQ